MRRREGCLWHDADDLANATTLARNLGVNCRAEGLRATLAAAESDPFRTTKTHDRHRVPWPRNAAFVLALRATSDTVAMMRQ